MTAAERDAAIIALERLRFAASRMGARLDGMASRPEFIERIDAEHRYLLSLPVERDELKDALLWHWAAVEQLRRLGPFGVLSRDQKPEFHWATIMRDDDAERVRELMEATDG